ncbi:MAG: CotH kinase family protein [Phycisphaerae bacterium]|nr:CotH kinase family protein [Saprospiraceae bacterium]
MKIHLLAFALLFLLGKPLSGQSTALYDDEKVASIYLVLPADSLNFLIDQLEHNRYLHAQFVFDDGLLRDTVENVGLRLRGNTSLSAQKKSFKISFNEFEAGREYQGVKKLNLRGQHNDPTMVREKLFYEVWEKAGMPDRRTAFVRLYINEEYRGLYTNIEELDKSWLGRVYDDNDGNLYKCTWPADLVYHGPLPQVYKAIMNNPEERAYDLKTNELGDDYTHLIELMAVLDKPVDAGFPDKIRQILNVESVLKSFAIDVATGNWDDYFYNKNNYYLYDNPTTGRFEFVTFDTDNTFGVDWLGKDWAMRNCLAWFPSSQPRPLATKLLAVPEFQNQYVRYLDTLTRFITNPGIIFPRIDALENQIAPAALIDSFRSLDYGYTFADFQNGFDQTIDGHTPYGIKPFLGLRHDSIRSQIAGLLSQTLTPDAKNFNFQIYPNPASDWLMINTAPSISSEKIDASVFSTTGQLVRAWEWKASDAIHSVSISDLPAGVYLLHLQLGLQEGRFVFLKAGQ